MVKARGDHDLAEGFAGDGELKLFMGQSGAEIGVALLDQRQGSVFNVLLELIIRGAPSSPVEDAPVALAANPVGQAGEVASAEAEPAGGMNEPHFL